MTNGIIDGEPWRRLEYSELLYWQLPLLFRNAGWIVARMNSRSNLRTQMDKPTRPLSVERLRIPRLPLILGVSIVLLVLVYFQRTQIPRRTYLIGYQNSPPDQIVLPDGSPGGPAVEIVREAAKRRGIRLQWVRIPAGPEAVLANGAVDLWPLFSDLPERKAKYFISKPWCSRRFWLAVDKSSAITRLSQIKGKTIAVRYPGTNASLASGYFPGASILRRTTFTDILRSICTGEADAGLMWGAAGKIAAD